MVSINREKAAKNAFIEELWRALKFEYIYLHCYKNAPDLTALFTSAHSNIQYYPEI